ncbi:mandelate racemase [Flavobacteriaceae bacterium TP-CH-4]|uniref:Mandelate racemase n=1 Tax=Pelagihabitans pacificus TaxID=2696054 RepID=A0A967E6F7_9FLAO|nr:enolase C-terminal domain-like protein [Pelagihabitans pacificus]NHF59550.1 mandelate racemase [Pelagihabitans pacificus]
MHRRHFLNRLAFASAATGVVTHSAFATELLKEPLKIKDLEIWKFDGSRPPSEGFIGWINSNPSQIYGASDAVPLTKAKEPRGDKIPYSALYLVVKTNTSMTGVYGPIDWEAALVVHHQLKRQLIGQYALDIEFIWDRLYRSNRHSRSGHYMMGLSAVDNALWDLRGKFLKTPVYQLIGGAARKQVPVYGSCLGFSVDPELVAERCKKLDGQGFTHQKWFFSFGPVHGRKGLEYNVLLAKTLRETLGNESDFMFDAYMGWNPDYALSWARRAEVYEPFWLEEAFQPAESKSFADLRKKTSIPIAAGEHLYNRWEVADYLRADALSFVQVDPEWGGGISELLKICSLASAFNVRVVPHGHNLHAALHVVASQSPDVCPMGEYLLNKMDHYYMFERDSLVPINGRITLADRPGFGIEFDDSKIDKRERLFS